MTAAEEEQALRSHIARLREQIEAPATHTCAWCGKETGGSYIAPGYTVVCGECWWDSFRRETYRGGHEQV